MKKKFLLRTMCCRSLEKQKIWMEMMLQSSRKKARKKELLQRRRLQQKRKLRKRMMTKKKKKKVKCVLFLEKLCFFKYLLCISKDYDDEDDVPVRTKKSAAKAVSVKREAVLDLVQDSPKKSEEMFVQRIVFSSSCSLLCSCKDNKENCCSIAKNRFSVCLNGFVFLLKAKTGIVSKKSVASVSQHFDDSDLNKPLDFRKKK